MSIDRPLPPLPPLTHLDRLEAESIHVLREVAAELQRPLLLNEPCKFIRRHWLCVIVALYAVNPQFADDVVLILCFNALCKGYHIHAL